MLEDYRSKIDKIDKEIYFLLNKRFEISKEIGNYKEENNISIENSAREKEILDAINKKEFDYNNNICEIYKVIFKESKLIQDE